MWTRENRGLYERKGARYPSDLRDTEWALIAPLVPPVKGGGRRREVDVREVLNGVLYVPETGCQWRALPKGLPPKSMVHDYLMLWDWDGTLERIHHELYLKTRDLEGCEASPSAGPWPMPPGGSGWSNAPPRPRASRPSPDAGSSNAPSPGSIVAAASPRTTSISTEPLSPSSALPASGLRS